jgi:hypothetical protein
MSTAPSHANSESQVSATTLRNVFVGALFAVVLLVTKIPHVRHNPKSWMLLRLLLGIAGAALVVFPVGMSNGYVISLIGLAMFVLAILLPPAKPETSADEKARELGALVVVNGGRYQLENGSSVAVRLFVGPESVAVLDARFQSLLVIPVNEITLAHAEQSDRRWLLHITWADHIARFSYRGVFAERLARVAETTLHSVMRPALPVIPQRRDASA